MTRARNHQTDMTHLALTLQLDRSADSGMLRALSLLHRRRCRVLDATFHAGAGATNQLELRLEAPPAHAHCLEAWLSSLADVREVRRLDDLNHNGPGESHLLPGVLGCAQ